MRIEVWGKEGCAKCEAAKAKLLLLGLSFEFRTFGNPGEDWRDTDAVVAMAWSAFYGGELPVITIDGEPLGYAAAMKRLRHGKGTGDA